MKLFFNLFINILIVHSFLFSQDYPESHIPAAHDITHSSGSICHGYAMGRAMGKTSGDAFCDPVTTYNNQIDQNYFTLIDDPTLNGIQAGDIIGWGAYGSMHSAYVVSVPNPLYNIGNIRVDQIPYPGGSEETNILLSDVMEIHGNPIGYYEGNRGLTIRFTFRNSFESGYLEYKNVTKPNWLTVNHAESKLLANGSTQEIKAIDNQEYPSGYMQRYRNWIRDKWDVGAQNPISEVVDVSRTFTANFSTEFNVEFRNDFGGSGGGQIKIDGITRTAPYVAKVLQSNPEVTAEALNGQNINGIIYNFDHWQDGITTNPRLFTVNDHAIFTAYYKAELHVQIDGPLYLEPYEVDVFTANPGGGSGTYIDYIWWKRNDSELFGMEGGIIPFAPPPGQWVRMSMWDGQQSVETGAPYDFSLKCQVTDSEYHTAIDVHSVYVLGGPADQDHIISNALISSVPSNYLLEANYPNPFNPSTNITFGLPRDEFVEMNVFSLTGQKVRTLFNGFLEKGYHTVTWNGVNENGSPVSAGIYIYELKTGDKRLVKKMFLMK
ncbi:MAG: T9SS type A sorting domain-containing protein [Calditrichaeota bacterium]|nr:T9SS type A sorting domain-containing protein [Calditrichota bacterium]